MMSTVGGGFVPPPTSHSNRELRERDRQRRREDGHRKQRAETVVGQFDLGGRQMTYQTGKRRRIIRSWLSGGGPGSGSGPRS
jgi:hypothetical protein